MAQTTRWLQATYSGLYEEGEVDHINGPTLHSLMFSQCEIICSITRYSKANVVVVVGAYILVDSTYYDVGRCGDMIINV